MKYEIKSPDWEKIDINEVVKLVFASRQALEISRILTMRDVEEGLQNFSRKYPAKIFLANSGAKLLGMIMLHIRNYTVAEMNPGILGGRPVFLPGEDTAEIGNRLIGAVVSWARKAGFQKIECISSLEEEDSSLIFWYERHGFHIYIRSVDMKRNLSWQALSYPEGFVVKPLDAVSEEALFQCYTNAFGAGDAKFFFDQDKQQRRDFFDRLGYAEALNESGSIALLKAQWLVGFSFVLPDDPENCHISCICIESEFRRKRLGEFLLKMVMNKALQQGYKTITLETNTSMGAYQLYKKNGFVVTGGETLWQRFV